MTNNEKVKQAINKNMASIYSALEQVGATLPEKKNLENATIILQDTVNNLILQENLSIIKTIDLMYGDIHTEEDYLEAYSTLQNYMFIHLYGGKNESY